MGSNDEPFSPLWTDWCGHRLSTVLKAYGLAFTLVGGLAMVIAAVVTERTWR